MAYGVFVVVDEVEESTDFGERERDKIPVDGWRFRLPRLVGWIVVLV
ncbi:MAG: hypothetical protein ACRDRS_08745 [Pseudonocardiaceae bacterium]